MGTLGGVTNFAKVQVGSLYTAVNTVIALATGEGSKLPLPSTDGAYPLAWYDSTNFTDPADDPNRELVWVGSRAGDTLVVSRGALSADGGGAASTKNTAGATYRMLLGPTTKLVHDIETYLVDQIPLGTISSLGWRYTGDQDTGGYRPAADTQAFVVGSVAVETLTSSLATFTTPLAVASGTGDQVANGLWAQSGAKAWVTVDTSGQIVIRDSFNISAVASVNGPRYTITFSRNFATANYVWASGFTDASAIGIRAFPGSKTAAGLVVELFNSAFALVAPSQICVLFMGVQ